MTKSFAAALAVLSACSTSKSLPGSMTGSFVRIDPAYVGTGASAARLEVTPTSLAAQPAGTGLETTGSAIKGTEVRGVTSVQIESVSCKGETCRFVGQGCEGTITKDDAGDLTIAANAPCAALSGKWLGPRSAASAPR